MRNELGVRPSGIHVTEAGHDQDREHSSDEDTDVRHEENACSLDRSVG
jgi:hypothetical protein